MSCQILEECLESGANSLHVNMREQLTLMTIPGEILSNIFDMVSLPRQITYERPWLTDQSSRTTPQDPSKL